MVGTPSRSTSIRTLLAIALFASVAAPGEAVREGSANANMMIRYHESQQEWGKAALWQEAAAKCMETISMPLAQITRDFFERSGQTALVTNVDREMAKTETQSVRYLKAAQENWDKARDSDEALRAERVAIDKFMAEWVPYYPGEFYRWATYREHFRPDVEALQAKGDFGAALLVEADASDMCARQYQEVTVRYFETEADVAAQADDESRAEDMRRQADNYQAVRNQHLRRSAMLRAFAAEDPSSWPPEADRTDFEVPESDHRLTAEQAIAIARKHNSIREVREAHPRVREYAWFQGFAWTVAYYTRDWEQLPVVLVSDETGEVIGVLMSRGNLEPWYEGESEDSAELNLTEDSVVQIAKKDPTVTAFLECHPGARTIADFNWRYDCWIVEVIVGDREAGVVSVSDETGEVLEVELREDE